MRKIFAFLFVVGLFLFVGSVYAGAPTDDCEYITVYCGENATTNLIACGSDNEKMAQVEECIDIFCN
ncbi:MAG: hypothetical protein AB7S48_14375 [Bacteroidales bacterium]